MLQYLSYIITNSLIETMSPFYESHLTHLTDEQTEAWRGLNDLLRVTEVTKAEARPRLKSLLTYHQVLLHFIYSI